MPENTRPAVVAVSATVVVPTFNEGGNIEELVTRLSAAFDAQPFEVLFVDDSTDDTPHVIREVAAAATVPVRMIHREGADRTGGLAGAVTAGVRAASTERVLVMDGDLQHPPEMAPLMCRALETVDVVVASRYCGTGDASGLSDRYRRAVSSSSTALVRICFPRRVGRVCTDPLTGFFAFRRASVDLGRLRPRGFKILLEILARHDLEVAEVPFVFGQRQSGESKAGWRNGMQFVHQMLALRMGRASRFAAVGAIGTVVNLAVMAALLPDLHYVAASIIGTEISVVANFLLQERFVFRDLRAGARRARSRLGQFLLFNNAEALVRLPVLVLAVDAAHVDSVLAQALTIAIAFVVRYLFVVRVVYRGAPAAPSLPGPDGEPVGSPAVRVLDLIALEDAPGSRSTTESASTGAPA